MQLLTRESDYALRALLYMGQSKKSTMSVTELIEKLKMPKAFMRKILQKLEKAGFLISKKGNKGGFTLKKKSEAIFIIDVMKAFQGKVSLLNCVLKSKICPSKKSCPLRKKIMSIEEKVILELGSVTLAGLLKG
jgi:Rrf2 family transcriptional regulator, cysteine metabolism repressor